MADFATQKQGSAQDGAEVGCTIILFAPIPVPGKTNEGLSAILGPEERATLQNAMALDVAERLATLGNPIQLSYADEWQGVPNGEEIRDTFIAQVKEICAPAASFLAVPQEGDDLGARMLHAMQVAFDHGARGCLLMGSDLPDIMHSDVQVAERALGYSDVVLGPSSDGGYWLVGLNEPFPELFEGKEYHMDRVLAEAVATCRAHDRKVALSRETFDVDVPEDYFMLCNQVAQGDFRLGARTVNAVRNLMPISPAENA